MPVFLATLGQRPQAITMALDALLVHYAYDAVGLLHTEPQHSGIADAYAQLRAVLERDYPQLPVLSHELRFRNGKPLMDIVDLPSSEAYLLAIAEVLRDYRVRYVPVHLLVAGGRKAMSVYATLAAAVLLGENDRVWTVLAEPTLLRTGVFHAPPGARDAVHVVHLPLVPSRLLPDVLASMRIEAILERSSPRQRFLEELSEQERILVSALEKEPFANNIELAARLSKAPKTIDNQFRSIFQKMSEYFDMNVTTARKRQMLLDVVAGRV